MVAGCAPGVRTMVSRVRFHSITGLTGACWAASETRQNKAAANRAETLRDFEMNDINTSPFFSVRGWFELQRVQESQQILLLAGVEFTEAPAGFYGLFPMPANGIFQSKRGKVMHVAGPHAQSPQSRGTQLVGCVLRAGLHNSVSGAHVVQQEVAKGMNDFVAERIGNGELAAIDLCTRRSGCNGRYMANGAAKFMKRSFAGLRRWSRGQGRIARRSHGAANKLGKVVNVCQSKAVGNIFGVRRGLANRSCVFGAQPVGNTHLIQISVANEREQRAVLVLPAEPAYAGLSWNFQNRNLNGFTMNFALTQARLVFRDGQQGLIVNGLNKTVSKRTQHGAQSANIFGGRRVLLGLGANGTVIDDGAVGNAVCAVIDQYRGIYKIALCVAMSHPDLGELARGPAHWILMAIHTGPRIEHRSQTSAGIMGLFENLLIEGIRVARRLLYAVADALRTLVADQSGRIKTGRRFRAGGLSYASQPCDGGDK